MPEEATKPAEGYKYQRVLLKLSGEALHGRVTGYGIDPKVIRRLGRADRATSSTTACELAITVGGGNIFRGARRQLPTGMDRAQADYIGMLATVMNALALQDGLERARRFLPRAVGHRTCRRSLNPTFACKCHSPSGERAASSSSPRGTGNPYFTTDTTAALRACEINADCMMKATQGRRHLRQRPGTQSRRRASSTRFPTWRCSTKRAAGHGRRPPRRCAWTTKCRMHRVRYDTRRATSSRVLKGEPVGTTWCS